MPFSYIFLQAIQPGQERKSAVGRLEATHTVPSKNSKKITRESFIVLRISIHTI